ncbi:MAG: hypothetical protein IPN33_26420 [Saprospiraceae bacterium]|nr:hypothetical protein [Saprospiraceae bacterium]
MSTIGFYPRMEMILQKKLISFFTVKNFGQRPAYDLNISVIFLKIKDLKVMSHGKQNTNISAKYQNVLFPGEVKQYKQENRLSKNGINDLNSLVAVFRFTYLDKVMNQHETTSFYYEHVVLNDHSYSIITAKPKIKKIVDDYLKSRKI